MANLLNPENRSAILQLVGPSGAGKGPTCELLTKMGPQKIGKRIGSFDRGAAGFRSVTVLANALGLDPREKKDRAKIEKAVKNTTIEYGLDAQGKPQVFVSGQDVTRAVRYPEVDRNVPYTADMAFTHELTDALQDQFIKDAILKGVSVIALDTRDIDPQRIRKHGLRVMTVELNSSLQHRAALRHQEFQQQGKNKSLEQVIEDIASRDFADGARENGRGMVKLNGGTWRLIRETDSVVPVAEQILDALTRF